MSEELEPELTKMKRAVAMGNGEHAARWAEEHCGDKDPEALLDAFLGRVKEVAKKTRKPRAKKEVEESPSDDGISDV